MDLCERGYSFVRRHPWERSRLKAIRSILQRIPIPEKDCRVLDIGCGDGFISQELAKEGRIGFLTGVDIHLSDRQISEMALMDDKVIYRNHYDDLEREYYNVILLLDVLEHVEQDEIYLLDIVSKYLAVGGYLVVTVPAFPFLYGSHDRFLKHHRRYTRTQLYGLIHSANLECLSSGYLFFSLLPARFLSSSRDQWFPPRSAKNMGVGGWNRGRIVTKTLGSALDADIRIALALQRVGITLPGLSVWALCRKQR
jgi:SAM-dependent methyltransferase